MRYHADNMRFLKSMIKTNDQAIKHLRLTTKLVVYHDL